jgi:hypothetical protein
MMLCKYTDCSNLGKLKGMCRKHYNAEYFKQNKESILISHRNYYKQNQEKMQKWRRDYHKKYPEVSRRNKLVRKNRENSKYKKYTDLEVLKLYGINCYICSEPIDLDAPRRTGKPGWQKGLHIDHLVPVALGGLDTIQNVRPTHGLCNLHKHSLEVL